MGKDYWEPIIKSIIDAWKREGWAVDSADMPYITDDVSDAAAYVNYARNNRQVPRMTESAIAKAIYELEAGMAWLKQFPSAVTILGHSSPNSADMQIMRDTLEGLAGRKEPVCVSMPEIYELAREIYGKSGYERLVRGVLLQSPQNSRRYQNDKQVMLVSSVQNYHVLVTENSHAFLALPGQIKTFSNLFDILEVIHTYKISPHPIILIGKGFWQPIKDIMTNKMLNGVPGKQLIDQSDPDLLKVAGSAEEIFNYLSAAGKPEQKESAYLGKNTIEQTSRIQAVLQGLKQASAGQVQLLALLFSMSVSASDKILALLTGKGLSDEERAGIAVEDVTDQFAGITTLIEQDTELKQALNKSYITGIEVWKTPYSIYGKDAYALATVEARR